jgi:hypothetical protein
MDPELKNHDAMPKVRLLECERSSVLAQKPPQGGATYFQKGLMFLGVQR